uniref:Uncharacterized protein n=1 Tax=Timema cristinae TaxID=61476 RepID=A0A7R9DFA6_TIMCR|nr:unnamed protein product [Timema cristinae]
MYIHCGSKLVDSGFESSFEKRVEHRVQEIWRTLQTTHLQDELSKEPESKYVCSNLVSNELKEDFKTTCVALNDNKKDHLNSENIKASVVDLCTNIIHSIQEEIQELELKSDSVKILDSSCKELISGFIYDLRMVPSSAET